LLAIAFAAGILSSQVPALSEKKAESTDLLIVQIANNTEVSPEVRAFYLLKLASSYLAGGDKTAVQAPFVVSNESSRIKLSRNWEDMLVAWAEQASLPDRFSDSGDTHKIKATKNPHAKDSQNFVNADAAIHESLTQLARSSDKLNLYLIASRLSKEAGNVNDSRMCMRVLEQAFQSCEGNSTTDEEEIKAASSVLNSMSYGLIPLHIPDQEPLTPLSQPPTPLPSYSEKQFKESEALKLRAVAMVDRLTATNDLRRKAHRNLALWYKQLGKTELAEKQKQILFELVGVNDDRILYPQQRACGHFVWWVLKENQTGQLACGMG
jgi:hypothetical protein